jgi:hypothetical protein
MMIYWTTSTAPGAVVVDGPEQYTVEHRIGRGGMGVVLAARAQRLGRPVAVKLATIHRELKPENLRVRRRSVCDQRPSTAVSQVRTLALNRRCEL